jgi:uncharacterized membrane protein YdjX (TVP38/TMEM64 family)
MSESLERREAASPISDNPTPGERAAAASGRAAVIWRRLGPAGPLAVIAASLPLLGEIALVGSLAWLAPWLRAHGQLGLLVYVLVFAVTSGLAILPTHAQSGIGGWVFHFRAGAPAAVAGVMGGALIGYLIARRASGTRVVSLIEEHPKWRAVYDALLGGGFWKTLLIVTLVRLPPSSPFAVTNLVLASTRVPPVAYLLGSFLGLAPRTVAVVFIGAGLQTLNFHELGRSWMTIAGIIAAAVVVVVIGAIANHAVTRVTATEQGASGQGGLP